MSTAPDFKIAQDVDRLSPNETQKTLVSRPIPIAVATALSGSDLFRAALLGVDLSAALTLPSAADIVASLARIGHVAAVGDQIAIDVSNFTGVAHEVGVGTGGSGAAISVAPGSVTRCIIRLDNVGSATEAYLLVQLDAA